MRILLVPMSAMVETSGPFSRVRKLTLALKEQGFNVALCAAEDPNYHKIENVKNYYLPIPVPLGLPRFIGAHVFPLAEKSGAMKKKDVHSFEEVLFMTGETSYRYFRSSIDWIRKAIKEYQPDLVYSEFNLSAIVAAKLEGIAVFSGYSFPVQSAYANSPQHNKGVNRVLKELGMNPVYSSLDLFEMADLRIVPSSYELEPINGSNIIFTGPFGGKKNHTAGMKKNKILAYMGNGTISKAALVKALTEGFQDSRRYEIYIAGKGLHKESFENIHMGEHFDFSEMLGESIAFINHGGQNSIMDGLAHGVPMIICPGKVFERKYNAESVVRNHAGIYLKENEFNGQNIKKAIQILEQDNSYSENAQKLGNALAGLGGTDEVIKQIKLRFQEN